MRRKEHVIIIIGHETSTISWPMAPKNSENGQKTDFRLTEDVDEFLLKVIGAPKTDEHFQVFHIVGCFSVGPN